MKFECQLNIIKTLNYILSEYQDGQDMYKLINYDSGKY